MIETAENLRAEYDVSREEKDILAARSHARAAAAASDGRFAAEIVPFTVPGRKGDTVVDRDEHIRPDSTVEKLATLKPIRAKVDPKATVTAGNASGQNDGAAACIVTTREIADREGLKPMAKMVSLALAGVGPAVMGIGPVASTQKALERASLKLADLDLIELNEAFAAQVLACTKALGPTSHLEGIMNGMLLMPLAGGDSKGTDLQEAIVPFLFFSLSFVMVAVAGLLLWGLRGPYEKPEKN